MKPRRFTLGVLLIALAWSAVADPADLPQPAQPPAPVAPATEAETSPGTGFAPPDSECLEWTDGCRTCQRAPADGPACSNVGIACVPQETRCTRR
jgi:hypothetical protein